MSTLSQNLTTLLATLRAIRWHAWNTHWKAKGPTAYSDHLLFQRIYSGDGGGPKIDDQIDGLGERIIALFGNDSVDGIEVSKKATRIHQGVTGLGVVAGALELEQEALKAAATVAEKVSKGPAELRISLDNFVRELADARSTVVYLLQQRLKGGSDSYGDLGSIGDLVSITTIVPYLVAGTVIGAAVSSYGHSADPVGGAKIGALGGLGIGLFRLNNIRKERESWEEVASWEREEDFGAAVNSTFSPYTSALFPVVISTAAGGLVAGSLGRDPKQGALVGAGLGVVWSVMQQRKQDEAAEVEVIEVEAEALPNNVVQLSSHPGYGAVDPAKAETKSKVMGWAMLGLMGYVAYWNHKQTERS